MIRSLTVVGGGSAGFLVAITLKARLPHLAVRVVRSKEIGIIGVGEGSTVSLTRHLHGYLNIDPREFYAQADPIWKLGIRFIWGRRPYFDYAFERQLAVELPVLRKPPGFFHGDGDVSCVGPASALMTENKVWVRDAGGRPVVGTAFAYHLENEKFVGFLEAYALRYGIEIVDDTISDVTRDDRGVSALRLASGRQLDADLYVDCSGFQSLLLGKALAEPFGSFRSSLFCDRAVVGGWERAGEPIKPYTTAETMDAGWCWQIEHERRINRGYVYSSAFVSDSGAEAEFRQKNPRVGPTRIVKFVTGHYRRSWVGNVVAVGNASGFVEPLESTSLAFIGAESVWLAEGLADADMEQRPTVRDLFNRRVSDGWETIRRFLAIHYRFNDRLDTLFWRECRASTDLAGAEEVVAYYRENGPSHLWEKTLLHPDDQFSMDGYLALLVGQRVPYEAAHAPSAAEQYWWNHLVQTNAARARQGIAVNEALRMVRSPAWAWPTLYEPICARPA
jgi:tryptophan halogenase